MAYIQIKTLIRNDIGIEIPTILGLQGGVKSRLIVDAVR